MRLSHQTPSAADTSACTTRSAAEGDIQPSINAGDVSPPSATTHHERSVGYEYSAGWVPLLQWLVGRASFDRPLARQCVGDDLGREALGDPRPTAGRDDDELPAARRRAIGHRRGHAGRG